MTPARISVYPALILCLLAGACTQYHVRGGYISVKPLTNSEGKVLTETAVKGRSCGRFVLGILTGDHNFSDALKDALEKAPPGATGLSHAFMTITLGAGGAMFGQHCYNIEGVPTMRSAAGQGR